MLLLLLMMIGRYQKRNEIHSRCIACCCNRTIQPRILGVYAVICSGPIITCLESMPQND
jgi:hypothetical protein